MNDEGRVPLLDEGRARPGQVGRARARRVLARPRVSRVPGGPFADRSGGLISFEADSLEHAEGIIAADPFVREDLLESSVVKEWLPE